MKSEIIIFKNVSVKISERNSLDNLNFSIKSGEFTYLIGKTGSGKSSIIKSMYADAQIKSGNCMVNGFDLIKIKKNQIPFLRRKIGIVFQDFKLLSDRTILNYYLIEQFLKILNLFSKQLNGLIISKSIIELMKFWKK